MFCYGRDLESRDISIKIEKGFSALKLLLGFSTGSNIV